MQKALHEFDISLTFNFLLASEFHERVDVNKWNMIKDKSITWHSVSNVRSYESVCQSSRPSWEKDVNIWKNIMCEDPQKIDTHLVLKQQINTEL